MAPSQLDGEASSRGRTDEPHLVFDSLDLDLVIKVLSKTIFSPFFTIFLPLTFLAQVRSTSHPAFIVSCTWTAIVCIFGALRHADRVYANQASWILAPPKLDWGDQIVLITGGGSGIGALLAETLAMRNVSVVVLTKDPPKYETQNENIYTYTCDVSDYAQVQAAASKIREEVGDPTIIVNNAGVVKGKLLLDLTEDDVKDTFGANTLAHFWTLKTFLPAMLARGSGHVVTMSSVLGVVGCAQMTDYCASKAALVNLHQSLRFELDNRYHTPGIRTTLLLPSFTRTSLFSLAALPGSRPGLLGAIWSFLAPELQPHVVVKAVIDALDAGESRVCRLPWYTHAARGMGVGVGVVPKWMADLLQRLAGADHAMSAYGPKPDAGERLLAERRAEASAEASASASVVEKGGSQSDEKAQSD
ncbi:hypothetical protein JCM24511_00561 [Saitozyma sp. JCM 24511]|nr:hypothetical protein JCM24511_00561 [Saitozyma sp. JCM 24511]